MKISELVNELMRRQKLHGDCDVLLYNPFEQSSKPINRVDFMVDSNNYRFIEILPE